MDPFVAEIRIVPFNFAPRGWAWCDGQLMPLSQNTALFSLLGTYYGGDGKSTFALPNLQGSAPMHAAQGPGLSQRFLGEQGGAQFVTLLQSEIPIHNHAVQVSTDPGDLQAGDPARSYARSGGGFGYHTAGPFGAMAFQALSPAGGDQPHNNMMPFLTCYFIIALQGVFPPRT
jgi:microcystin-dependent protein